MLRIKLASELLWDLQMLEPDPIAIEENMPNLPILVLIAIM